MAHISSLQLSIDFMNSAIVVLAVGFGTRVIRNGVARPIHMCMMICRVSVVSVIFAARNLACLYSRGSR